MERLTIEYLPQSRVYVVSLGGECMAVCSTLEEARRVVADNPPPDAAMLNPQDGELPTPTAQEIADAMLASEEARMRLELYQLLRSRFSIPSPAIVRAIDEIGAKHAQA